VTGNGVGADTLTGSAANNLSTGKPVFPVTAPILNNRYQVNLPVASPAGTIGLSLLHGANLLDLELSAAQNEGRGEVISSPRVITANQKPATIMQGVEIPLPGIGVERSHDHAIQEGRVVSQSDTADYSRHRVILDLDVNDDSVGQLVQSATGGSVPSIDTREILTQVLVNDGQTVVLGGILETTKTASTKKCPISAIYRYWIPVQDDHRRQQQEGALDLHHPKILREGSNLY